MKNKSLLRLAFIVGTWMTGYPIFAWDEPTQVDGVWQLGSVNDVEWFADHIEAGNSTAKAVLTADIDYEGKTHTPIGQNETRKFNGVFDGQHHHIKNLTMTGTNTGFFGYVRGGSTIRNIIIDATCSFTATERCGSLIGFIQAKAGGVITISNVVNYASVTSGSKVAGGILAAGATNNDHPVVNMSNCVNVGRITCTGADKAAGLLGWNKSASNSTLKGCYNIGECTPLDGVNNLFRGTNRAMPNCYDLTNTTAQGKTGTQGLKTNWLTLDPLHSGELCYVLNTGDMSANGIKYTQDLSDPNSIPLPIPGMTVYQVIEYNCDGSVRAVSYNNTAGSTSRDEHVFDPATGLCTRCSYPKEDWITVSGDGFYHLSSVAEVEWLSSMVKNGGGAAFYAKLTNDIDFQNIENLHNPIGPAVGCKFKGVFDGQGHRIMNMIINRPSDNNIGFFGFLQGNATTEVKNLIIDSSCTIHANNRVGGLTGSYQNPNGTITIENVVNEATVIAEHQDAGGIFGGHESGDPTIIIRNCVNAGNITAKNAAPYAGALCCYLGVTNTSKIENFLNIGTVNGHNGGNIGRHNISDVTNIIDLSATTSKTQGVRDDLTTADLTNGKVAYIMGFKQLIGSSEYPSPLNDSEVLYVGDAGYATMYDADNDWGLNGDAQAYIGTLNGNYLHLSEIDDVPAGTAVIIGGTYYNKVSTTATANATGNNLLGSDGTVSGNGIYALADRTHGVGFYPVSNSISVPAGKAYLQVSGNAVKEFYPFGEEETTSLNEELRVKNEELAAVYDLSGRLINSKFKIHNSKLRTGIYIQNGKKVIF